MCPCRRRAAEPWRRSSAEVAAEFGVDIRVGLTSAEALTRLARYGPNEINAAVALSAWRKLLGQFANPLIYLLIVAVVVSFVAWVLEGSHGAPFEVIVISAIIILNAVLGYWQQARAEQAVAALQRMAAALAGVVRYGRSGRIAAADVVPGDVLILVEGDAVSADVEAASLTVAEASLTGESEAVVKEVETIAGPVLLSLTILMIAIVVAPQISGSGDVQRSLTIITVVFALIGFAMYVWCFFTARETVTRTEVKVTLRDTVSMMRSNRPLILLCVSSLLYLTGMFSLQTVGVYYARDVLDNADLYIVMTVVETVGMIIASALVPGAVATFGKKKTYILFGTVAALSGLAVASAPGSAPAVGLTAFGILGLGLGAVNTLIFALQARHGRLRRVVERHSGGR